jgi:hypothetical protein
MILQVMSYTCSLGARRSMPMSLGIGRIVVNAPLTWLSYTESLTNDTDIEYLIARV